MANKTFKGIAFIVIIGIVLALILYPKLNSGKDKSKSPQELQKKKQTLVVSGIVMQYEPFDNSIFSTGTIISNEEVELKSEISGKITKINFKEGSRVRKGDLLIKINDSELQAQLKKNVSRLKLAETREFRQKKLLEQEGISQENYDIAVNEVETIKAEIELIKAQIEKTEITAPFDGVIGLRYISDGAYVTPTTNIATIQNNNPIKIDFSIPQKYFSQVTPGRIIYFKIPNVPKK